MCHRGLTHADMIHQISYIGYLGHQCMVYFSSIYITVSVSAYLALSLSCELRPSTHTADY
jgi:hypothetical protein